MKKYPDIRPMLKQKAAHRRALAELSFEKKMEIVFRLQNRRKFIKSGIKIKDDLHPRLKSD